MEKDERRDEEIASKLCLQPNSKHSGVTQDQLSKFQELQRRRLQLISKPKTKKFKVKGAKAKLRNEELDTRKFMDDNSEQGLQYPSISSSSSQGSESNEMLSASPKVDVHPVFQKKKLHWGLDSKERWERKANM